MSRYRTRNHSIDVSMTRNSVACPRSLVVLDEMWDEVTPGYFRLSKTGQYLPVNAMIQKTKRFLDPGTMQLRYKSDGSLKDCNTGNGTTWNGPLGYWVRREYYGSSIFPAYPTAHLAVATANQLLPEAMAEARLSQADILTMLSELDKTVELILRAKTRTLDRAERISTALRKQRRWDVAVPRNAKNGAFLLKMRKLASARTNRAWDDAFWNSWMEDRYGWRILAYDLEALHELYLKWKAGVGNLVRSKAVDSSEVIGNSVARQQSSISNGCYGTSTGKYTVTSRTDTETIRKVGLGYEFAVNTLVTVDPLVTLLEIIPYSFVADWFTNIGDIVRGYSPFGAGSIVWAYETTRTQKIVVERATFPGLSWYINRYVGFCPEGSTCSFEAASAWTVRTPLTTIEQLKPSLRFYNKLDIPKVLDLIGVLRGIGGGLKLYCRI